MKIGKRKIFLIIGLIVLVLAACSNVDGDLDDKWQLRQYQYADGSIERQDSKVWKTKTIHSIWGGKMENGHLQWKN